MSANLPSPSKEQPLILKSNNRCQRAFSLLEVIVAVAVLSTAIIFIFRSFTTILSLTKLNQNIASACLLAEGKLWEIEQRHKDLKEPIPNRGKETIRGRDFEWEYSTEVLQTEATALTKLEFNIGWKENAKRTEKLSIITYLPPKQ